MREIDSPILGIGFGSQYEETADLVHHVQAREVEIGPVHDIERTDFGEQLIQNVDIMQFAIGDMDESRDYCRVSGRIKQGVEFDRCLTWCCETVPRETATDTGQWLKNPVRRRCCPDPIHDLGQHTDGRAIQDVNQPLKRAKSA